MENSLEMPSSAPSVVAEDINNRPLTFSERFVGGTILTLMTGETTREIAGHCLSAISNGDKASAIFYGLGAVSSGIFTAASAALVVRGDRFRQWTNNKSN